MRKPFNEAMAEGKVRAAAVNDENNFGKAFADKMADHIESTDEGVDD